MIAFSVLFFIASQVDEEKIFLWVSRAALASAGLSGLYGILQYSGNEIFTLMPNAVGSRVWSSLGNPIYFGAITMMAFPLVFRPPIFTNALAGAFIFAGMMISLSRGAWLGAGAALVGAAYMNRMWVRKHWIKIAGVGMSLAALSLRLPQVRERLSVLVSPNDSTSRARLEGWKAGVAVWKHHPVLGTGPDTFFEAFRPYRTRTFMESAGYAVTQAHAHNELIQVASTMGTLGFMAWLGVLLTWGQRVRFIYKRNPTEFIKKRGPLLASVAAIFIQNLFNPSAVASACWAAVFSGLLMYDREAIHREDPWPNAVRNFILVMGGILGVVLIGIPWHADHNYKEGLVSESRGKALNALDDYREAVRWRPDIEVYESALSNLARTVAQQMTSGVERERLWQEAWESTQKSVRWHPSNPDNWNNAGVAAMWLTQLAGRDYRLAAKEAFEKAIALDPVFIDAWANLAKWQHLAGDLEGEKKTWRHVLELNPHHEMALNVVGPVREKGW